MVFRLTIREISQQPPLPSTAGGEGGDGDKAASTTADAAEAIRPRLVELGERSASEWLEHVDWLARLANDGGTGGVKVEDGGDSTAMQLAGALRARLVWRAMIGCRELEPLAALQLCDTLVDLGTRGQLRACVGACLAQLLPDPEVAGLGQQPHHHQRQSKLAGGNSFVAGMRRALSSGVSDAALIVGEFVRFCADYSRRQHQSAVCLPLLTSVLTASRIDANDSPVYQLLLELLQNQFGDRILSIDDDDESAGGSKESWLDVQPVPNDAEFREASYVRGLQPVIVKGPYKSVDQYYDTYFRLYRADCFEHILTGIEQLRAGRLDPRDLPLYGQVQVWAVRLSTRACALSVAVQFTELGGRRVTNWKKSPRLMQGNLVCLSTDGTFDADSSGKIIWATVTSRDPVELEKHHVIWLEFGCGGGGGSGSSSLSDTEALQALVAATPSGATVMAESPSLFRAFEPVLRSLQLSGAVGSKKGAARLPFKSVLVDADMREADSKPDYIKSYYGTGMPQLPNISTGSITLDPCQSRALTNALHRRVALIQGPPGTGKSFLGVLLMRQILSLPSGCLPSGHPVLVMSYKNHALDEFLSDLMPLFPDQIVRVGGRCSNPNLEAVSLNTLRKDDKRYPKSRSLSHDLFEAYSQLEVLQNELTQSFQHVGELLSDPCAVVQSSASQAQLRTLLVNWRPGPPNQLLQQREALMAWSELKKPLEDTDATSEWLADDRVKPAVRLAAACWLPSKTELRAHATTSAEALLEGPLSRVLAGFEAKSRDFWAGRKGGKANNNNPSQNSDGNNKDDDDADDEEVSFQLSLRQSAFINQMGRQKSGDKVVHFKPLEGMLTATAAAALVEGFEGGRLAAKRVDLWRLDTGQRCALARYWLTEALTKEMTRIDAQLAQYLLVSEKRKRLQRRHCIEIVRTKRILGMTITGASINKDIITAVKPAVILVEEAAEVGEPQLLSCLTDATQHLILIGDHKQLRPQTESFLLREKYHLDVSMFERLINNGIPYDQLELQNRMRPEFSRLLLDIYPNLRDNRSVVDKHTPVPCLDKSMYFWTHNKPEISDRSYMNPLEAERAVKLACFLATVGEVKLESITILAMYRGQTALIRRMLKEELKLHRLLPPPGAEGEGGSDLPITVHTVDLYQGDENDIIIVSLVRSNPSSKLGFLKDLSRRCVAQSRARRGMYLLGNAECLAGSHRHPLWRVLIDAMSAVGCVGPALRVVCPRHHAIGVDVADHNKDFPSAGFQFCDQLCGAEMHCGRHKCEKLCRVPRHRHDVCKVLVDFQHDACSHPGKRLCSEDPLEQKCMAQAEIVCKSCGKSDTKPCHVSPDKWSCQQPCQKKLACGHMCLEKCSDPCQQPTHCKVCKDIKAEKQRQVDRLEEEIKSLAIKDAAEEWARLEKEPIDEFKMIKLEPTSSEYLDVQDRVTKYIQTIHNWFPEVTSICRVHNVRLRRKFVTYRQSNAIDPTRVELKFHGTSTAGVEGITKEGFNMPKTPGMYGAGIYFASDASKSAQELYTKGSQTLLLCEVILGKSLRVTAATNNTLNWKTLRQQKCDSIFAPRGTKETGGVLYDEFVVFNPAQAYPKYVIKYNTVSGHQAQAMIAAAAGSAAQPPPVGNSVRKIPASVDEASPDYAHFNVANALFLASFSQQGNKVCPYRVTEVWHNSNPRLEAKFNAKRMELMAKYGAEHQFAKPVFAFHGTKTSDIVDSILSGNFDLKKLLHCAFGFGVYLSEYAEVSVGYGTEMLLCQVLPGNSQDNVEGHSKGAGYDSIRVKKAADGRGWALVIDNVDQILPLYKVVFN